MRRPLLLGLDNPHGGPPGAALLPRPRGGAGYRLLVLSGMAWSEYRSTFERRNVVDVLPSELRHRTVLVMGKEAWSRIRTDRPGFFGSVESEETSSKFILLPHPSGRNLLLNGQDVRDRMALVLRSAALEYLNQEELQ